MKTVFETKDCSRCGGTGRFGGFGVYFKCGGARKLYTKRGAKAKAYLDRICTVPVSEVVVGDRVLAHSITNGGQLFDFIGTVTGISTRKLNKVTERKVENGTLVTKVTRTDMDGNFVSSSSCAERCSPGQEATVGTTASEYVEYTVTISGKYGEHQAIVSNFRVYRDDNAEKIKQALEYQAGL
jgi:hypothetical protein